MTLSICPNHLSPHLPSVDPAPLAPSPCQAMSELAGELRDDASFWDETTRCPVMFGVRWIGRRVRSARHGLPTSADRGFTLVELLVVIGVIAALMGLLIPALSKARGQANAIACQSNLRSMGQALLLYANANKNRLPWVVEPFWQSNGTIDLNVDPTYQQGEPDDRKFSLYRQLEQMWRVDPTKNLVCRSAVVGYPFDNFKMTYRVSAVNNYDGQTTIVRFNPSTSSVETVPLLVENMFRPNGAPIYTYSLKMLNYRPYKLLTYDPNLGQVVKGVGYYYLIRDFVSRRNPQPAVGGGYDYSQFFPHNNKTFNQLKLDMSVTSEKEVVGEGVKFYP